MDCPFDLNHNCGHNDDAGVQCSSSTSGIKLVASNCLWRCRILFTAGIKLPPPIICQLQTSQNFIIDNSAFMLHNYKEGAHLPHESIPNAALSGNDQASPKF